MALYQPKNPKTVEAIQLTQGTTINGNRQHGEAGDYVVVEEGSIWILTKAEFEAKYVPLPAQG